ncbi:fibroblast growth factor 1-like [Dendronephthya gigantea]|uniref:fibroblast growth factor 1-like n=1 Tax=Dendronephthya gigantea TaxID=151771 RepID=UPI00106CEA30|nr:fibroblast growth factor 1-like [Dendronephthya gigantea]
MSACIRSSTLPLLKYTRTRILQSRHGLYLELRPNGVVQTTVNIRSPFIFLQFLTVGTNMVAIWGVDSRLYLAIDEDGTVFTTKAESKECVFKEYVTGEFFSQFETCHKNEDDFAWYLSVDSNGKVTAKPDTKEHANKNLNFIVKIPAEQVEFCKNSPTDRRTEKRPMMSHTRKFMLSQDSSSQYRHRQCDSMVQRVFSTRAACRERDSQSSEIMRRQSSSDSQYSQSERSYSFTDSMEIAGFTSDSSVESFKGIYDGRL